jgi:hypothetical protein
MSTLPEHYALFDDPNDVRNGQWLTGLQYLNDGYSGKGNHHPTKATISFTAVPMPQCFVHLSRGAYPNIVLRQDSLMFDAGYDVIFVDMGYRILSFIPIYFNHP